MGGPGNGAALRVGAGIILTRLLGLVRERVFAHYFGAGPWADAFRAALKIPNVVRNLLGEGTLSASFIPVFAGKLEDGDNDAAADLAGAVVSFLVLFTALITIAGILLAPVVTTLVAANFDGYTRELTIRLVRIMFPMSGFMVLSAWCLGVLNSNRRFFLSYAAPSLWNIAQIGTLVTLGATFATGDLVVALAWGALVGGLAQFLVQVPSTVRLLGRLRLSLSTRVAGLQEVFRAWIPVILGAGVMQISSIIDTQLGSFAGPGGVALLGYAQLLAILPVSLFGISVAASELPEMSRDAVAERSSALLDRIVSGHRRIGFFVIPSAIFYVGLGDSLISVLLQTGRFSSSDTAAVAAVLAAYAVGLPAQAMVKLLASGHYAAGDTRTPMRISVLSLFVSASTAVALLAPLGVVGIAVGSSAGILLNVTLNSALLGRKLGSVWRRDAMIAHGRTAVAGFGALVAATLLRSQMTALSFLISGLATIAGFTIVFAGLAIVLRHPDALSLVGKGRRDP